VTPEHRNTVKQILAHPASGNVEWRRAGSRAREIDDFVGDDVDPDDRGAARG
jgi:hypothetical protein